MNMKTDLPTIRRLIDTKFYVFKVEIKNTDGSEYAIIHTDKGVYRTHLRDWIDFFKNNDVDSSVEFQYNMGIDRHRTELERKVIKCWIKGGYIRTKDKNGNCAYWHAIIERDDIVRVVKIQNNSHVDLKHTITSAINIISRQDVIEFCEG